MFWLLVRVNTVVPEAPGSSSELPRYKANQNPEDEFQRNGVLHLEPPREPRDAARPAWARTLGTDVVQGTFPLGIVLSIVLGKGAVDGGPFGEYRATDSAPHLLRTCWTVPMEQEARIA